jgi:hypothetical protein
LQYVQVFKDEAETQYVVSLPYNKKPLSNVTERLYRFDECFKYYGNG